MRSVAEGLEGRR